MGEMTDDQLDEDARVESGQLSPSEVGHYYRRLLEVANSAIDELRIEKERTAEVVTAARSTLSSIPEARARGVNRLKRALDHLDGYATCTYKPRSGSWCGLPEDHPVHPKPDEPMNRYKHVFRAA